MLSKLEPVPSIWLVMLEVAPLPIASRATTVATPITIPSMVRMDRILLARMARRAILKFSESNIDKLLLRHNNLFRTRRARFDWMMIDIIRNDISIRQLEDPVRVPRDVRVVRHQD